MKRVFLLSKRKSRIKKWQKWEVPGGILEFGESVESVGWFELDKIKKISCLLGTKEFLEKAWEKAKAFLILFRKFYCCLAGHLYLAKAKASNEGRSTRQGNIS